MPYYLKQKAKCVASCERRPGLVRQSLWATQKCWFYLGSEETWSSGIGRLSKMKAFRNGWPLTVEVCLMECCCSLLADFQKPGYWPELSLIYEISIKSVPVVMFYLGNKKNHSFLEDWHLVLSHQIGYRYFIVLRFYLKTNLLVSIMLSETCYILQIFCLCQSSFRVIQSQDVKRNI